MRPRVRWREPGDMLNVEKDFWVRESRGKPSTCTGGEVTPSLSERAEGLGENRAFFLTQKSFPTWGMAALPGIGYYPRFKPSHCRSGTDLAAEISLEVSFHRRQD